MIRRRAVIEVQASRIDLAEYEGSKRAATRRIDVALGNDVTEWCRNVRRAVSQLRPFVAAQHLEEAPAVVLYRSPSQSVELGSFAVDSAGDAEEAGRLACVNTINQPADLVVCAGRHIGRDRTGTSRRRHVVAVAERTDIVSALLEMTEESGLNFEFATPIIAPITADLLGYALADKRALSARLYVGEQSSVFLVAGNGTLLFARTIQIGIDALVVSLTRPIRRSSDETPLELDWPTACSLLHQFGYPDPQQEIDAERGLKGAHVLPLIEPVSQRFIVELRQSLRFGLPESQKDELSIELSGPGSSVPGLARVLARELGLEVNPDARYEAYDYQQPGSRGGEMVDARAAESHARALALLPPTVQRARRAARMKRALWTGAAAALLMIAFDAVHARQELRTVRAEAVAMKSNIAGSEALQATVERLSTTMAAMQGLEKRITGELGPRAELAAYMHELSLLTPDAIRFNRIVFRQEQAICTVSMSGFRLTESADDGEPPASLESFIAALRDSSLFTDAKLGMVQQARLYEQPAESFQATVFAVTLPRGVATIDLASATADEAPR